MKAEDVERTVERALSSAGLHQHQRPKLLSDNGACYIASNRYGNYFFGILFKVDYTINSYSVNKKIW